MRLTKARRLILSTLFPQFCLYCEREGRPLCLDCLSTIVLLDKPINLKDENKYLDGLFSACSYENPLIKELIRKLKYSPYLKDLAQPLAYLIISHFMLLQNNPLLQTGENSLASVLAPVPLSPAKQRQRGYNQSELIAKQLSSIFSIPLLKNNLIKTKKTPAQAGLSREERIKNLQGAFGLKNPLAFNNKQVFLVDDVFTTGSTMNECAKLLKHQARASKVFAITAAYEPLSLDK